ncbi:MAG: hypothetical protein AAF850_01385 [Pseudomonadota bacterium]
MFDFLDTALSSLATAFTLAMGALTFDETVFRGAAENNALLGPAILIAFVAGISEMSGQSFVLVINRVPLYRFAASLVLTGFVYMFTAAVWWLSVAVTAKFFYLPLIDVAGLIGLFSVIAISYAPRLFGVLTIGPYFGVAFGYLLDAWTMSCVIFGLHAASGLPLWATALCGVAGWTTSTGLRALFGRVLKRPLKRLQRLVAGSPLEMTPQQLLSELGEYTEIMAKPRS